MAPLNPAVRPGPKVWSLERPDHALGMGEAAAPGQGAV